MRARYPLRPSMAGGDTFAHSRPSDAPRPALILSVVAPNRDQAGPGALGHAMTTASTELRPSVRAAASLEWSVARSHADKIDELNPASLARVEPDDVRTGTEASGGGAKARHLKCSTTVFLLERV